MPDPATPGDAPHPGPGGDERDAEQEEQVRRPLAARRGRHERPACRPTWPPGSTPSSPSWSRAAGPGPRAASGAGTGLDEVAARRRAGSADVLVAAAAVVVIAAGGAVGPRLRRGSGSSTGRELLDVRAGSGARTGSPRPATGPSRVAAGRASGVARASATSAAAAHRDPRRRRARRGRDLAPGAGAPTGHAATLGPCAPPAPGAGRAARAPTWSAYAWTGSRPRWCCDPRRTGA